jgi:hypothetical protein
MQWAGEMKRRPAAWLLALLVSSAIISGNVRAADDLPEGFSEKPNQRFVASKNPYYQRPEDAISSRVADDAKNHRVNHFCVVGYQWKTGVTNAWVLWKEEATLILWEGNRYPDLRKRSLITSRRNLKLGRDTVKTEDDINGSTYLVTEQWWHAIADDCMKHGEKYIIKPFKVSKPANDGSQ